MGLLIVFNEYVLGIWYLALKASPVALVLTKRANPIMKIRK